MLPAASRHGTGGDDQGRLAGSPGAGVATALADLAAAAADDEARVADLTQSAPDAVLVRVPMLDDDARPRWSASHRRPAHGRRPQRQLTSRSVARCRSALRRISSGFVKRGDRRREILTDRHDAIETGGVQETGDVGPVTEHGDDFLVLPHLRIPPMSAPRPAESMNCTPPSLTTGEPPRRARRKPHGRLRRAASSSPQAELGVIGTLETIYTDLKHGRMVTPFRRRDTRSPLERGPTRAAVYHPERDGHPSRHRFRRPRRRGRGCGQLEPISCRVRAGVDVVPAIMQVDPGLVLPASRSTMGGVAACLAVRQREEMGDVEPRPVASSSTERSTRSWPT